MRICIVGAGSLGMLFAAKLALASGQVIVLTRREEQAIQLNDQGIILTENHLEYRAQVRAVAARHAERALHDGEFDWIFLMLKQPHLTAHVADNIRSLLGERGKLLCFQNGIGHADFLAGTIDEERIYVAVTTEAARKQGDTCVAHTGSGTTWLGRAFVPPSYRFIPDDDEKKLTDMLKRGGFQSFLSKEMDRFVWTKLLINSVINPLTAIWRVNNGGLLERPERLELMRLLLDEGIAVADACGIRLPSGLWEQLLEVCQKTSQNNSSMLQDVMAGQPTEIDWINGGILRLAQYRGLKLSTHQTVYRIVKAMNG